MKKLNINSIKLLFLIDSIKRGWARLREQHDNLIHSISTGSANSITICIITVVACVLSFKINNANITLAQIQLDQIEQRVKLADIHANTIIKTTKQKADALIQAEEIRAAANPYVIAAAHRQTPINVYIDTNNSKYIIETSDGATEIAISTVTVKGVKYTPEQRKLMTMAFYIGKEVGFPETIQSLLLQETRAGALGDRIGDINLPIGKRSYGVMQMKVATARKVLKKYPELVPNYFPKRKSYKRVRDEEIIIKLIQDDEFNIRLAAMNFVIHRQLSNNWAKAVVAYNTGQGGANKISEPKKHKYYVNIVKKLVSEVRPFNTKTKLSL